MSWWNGTDVGYTGSGWGHGLRQLIFNASGMTKDADSLTKVITLSLLHSDSAYLTGDILEKVRQDPAQQNFESTLISDITSKHEYGNEPFTYSKESLDQKFGGSRAAGSISDFSKTGKNPLSWTLRHADVYAFANVNTEGDIHISYEIRGDRLDLSPKKYRSFWYNVDSVVLGVPFHIILGGNDQLRVYANWQTNQYNWSLQIGKPR